MLNKLFYTRKLLCTKRNLCENEMRELNFNARSENTSRDFSVSCLCESENGFPAIISREVTA